MLGPIADQVAREMREVLGSGAVAPIVAAPAATPEVEANLSDKLLAQSILLAIGGRGNLQTAEAGSDRLLIAFADAARMDEPALAARLGIRGVVKLTDHTAQLLLGRPAGSVAQALAAACGRLSFSHDSAAPMQ